MKFSEIETKTLEQIKEMGLEIKEYLPMDYKIMLVNDIERNCICKENNISYIDYTTKELAYVLAIVGYYTNIEDDILQTIKIYDLVKQIGLFDYIYNQISIVEIKTLNKLISDTLNQKIEVGNSISNILDINFSALIAKIPNEVGIKSILKSVSKQFKSMDLEKITKAFEKQKETIIKE